MTDLETSERLLLQRFALFPSQPFGKQQVLDLFAIPPEEQMQAGNTVRSLVKKGWIQQTEDGFHCHQVIRCYLFSKYALNLKNIKL